MDYAPRNRSYEVQRQIPKGSRVYVDAETRVRISDDPVEYETRPPAEGTLLWYTNAGFRGIEATIRFDDGKHAHGVSAGYLRLPEGSTSA